MKPPNCVPVTSLAAMARDRSAPPTHLQKRGKVLSQSPQQSGTASGKSGKESPLVRATNVMADHQGRQYQARVYCDVNMCAAEAPCNSNAASPHVHTIRIGSRTTNSK